MSHVLISFMHHCRASILLSVVETLRGFVNVYENLASFPEIFMPMSSLLDEVIEQANIPDILRGNMEALTDLIKKKADKHETSRLPLQMRKQKPAPIKLLNPKFEEEYAFYISSCDMFYLAIFYFLLKIYSSSSSLGIFQAPLPDRFARDVPT